ncbi:hypothetical protein MBLNU457_7665t1 [Dothideomycetes sp. NU457]
MSIHALPQNAVRAIGASQVFADPTAVIKELLENALDAHATSVSIDISANTLDVIQVRDNGHGVPPEDRPLVAKRYCTSKIKDENDLAAIGGSSLGFRGEALASAAEMSDTMTITTRVEGEAVATLLKVSHDGSILAQEPVSHAVGTTVRITGFLKAHPVRRQVALKNSQKYSAKIKQILQAYAFTRSATRLSFGILKAPSSKDNWRFAGRADSPITDTALKIVDKACASQCQPFILEEDGFQLASFLPKTDADWSKVCGFGQFISVDDRPLSTSRGLTKQLGKIFREALKNRSNQGDTIKEPFMYLNMVCPPQSYDANIEPAKDDVLFEDPDKVINLVRKLFASAYPAKEQEEDIMPRVVEDLVTRQLDEDQGAIPLPEEPVQRPPENEPARFSSTMFELDEDLVHHPTQTTTPHEQTDALIEESSPAVRDITISNPWTQARINSLRRSGLPAPQAVNPAQDKESSPMRHEARFEINLPTPAHTSPIRPLVNIGSEERTSPVRQYPDLPTPETNRRPIPADDPTQQSPQPLHLAQNAFSSSPMMLPPQNTITPGTSNVQGTPLSMIPEATPKRSSPRKNTRGQFVNKPFRPPVPKERDAWFDIPEARKSQQFKRTPKQGSGTQTFVPYQEEQLGDNVLPGRRLTPPSQNTDIRAFMGGHPASRESPRIEAATPDDTILAVPATERQPHPQGFILASRVNVDDLEQENCVLKDAAPRTRRTKSGRRVLSSTTGNAMTVPEIPEPPAEQPSKRPQCTKSSMLPLERIPVNANMQNVNIKPAVTREGIERSVSTLDKARTFIGWNEPALAPFDGFKDIDKSLLSDWTMRLEVLLRKKWPDGEVIGDIGRALEQAMSREDDAESVTDSEMLL